MSTIVAGTNQSSQVDDVALITAAGRPYVTDGRVTLLISHEADRGGLAATATFAWARTHLAGIKGTHKNRVATLDYNIESALFDGDTMGDTYDDTYTSTLAMAVKPLLNTLRAFDPQLWEYDIVHLLLFATTDGANVITQALKNAR